MARVNGRRTVGPLLPLFEGPAAGPLWSRLRDALRAHIASGALGPGVRLPSARALAVDLSVSRHTVEAALSELEAEGLLTRRAGAGTYVSALVERDGPPPSLPLATRPGSAASLSRRGRMLADASETLLPATSRAFAPCAPSADAFPRGLWAKLLERSARSLGDALTREPQPQGHLALRQAIADHLAQSRGLRCTPEEVLVVRSTQESLALSAFAFLEPGEEVWVEDPGYHGAHAAFAAAGLCVRPVPVDGEGLVVAEGLRTAPRARLAYLTPSCQFPTGIALSPPRRERLLAWAGAAGALLFEDDYDSELRYEGRPQAAITALDRSGHTLYSGTFNKALFSSLRLAYLVAPSRLMRSLVAVRAAIGGPPPTLPQAALAAFISEGHLGAHVRRLRAACEERRNTLRDAVARDLAGRVTLHAGESGQHAVAWLRPGEDDLEVSRRAALRGLEVPPISRYAAGRTPPPGLLLSFSAATPAEIRAGVRMLARCL